MSPSFRNLALGIFRAERALATNAIGQPRVVDDRVIGTYEATVEFVAAYTAPGRCVIGAAGMYGGLTI